MNVLVKLMKVVLSIIGFPYFCYKTYKGVRHLVDYQIPALDKQITTLDKQITTSKSDKYTTFLKYDVHGGMDSVMYTMHDDSKAQLKQDLFVLAATNSKKNGFFVEFGATNGIDLSNTYLLEKKYNWDGILAEPAKVYQQDLLKNRAVNIDFSCIWRKSGELLDFNECESGVLSTIAEFSDKDFFAETREQGTHYEVETLSLLDLLKKYNAPKEIDYLSIDTEGSEFEILNSFDFTQYDISIITCEHNFTDDREKIFKLLTSKGYVRKYETFSACDDWYFKQ